MGKILAFLEHCVPFLQHMLPIVEHAMVDTSFIVINDSFHSKEIEMRYKISLNSI